MRNSPLKISFLVSLGVHSLLFSPLLEFMNQPLKIDEKKIEVTYINIKKEEVLDTKPIPIEEKEVTLRKDKKIEIKKEEVPPDIPPQEKEQKEEPAQKPAAAKEEPKAPKKKTIKPVVKARPKDDYAHAKTIDLNSISLYDGSSSSLNFLRSIRNKINRYVHKHYDISMGDGEALLHFVLNSDGTVEFASIIKDNLENKKRLRYMCLDSIYHSSPFNSFPDDLDLDQAAFNITISFKSE